MTVKPKVVPEVGPEFWVNCRCCAHEWIAAYLPMEISKVGRLLQDLHCPKCGSDSNRHYFGKVPT